MSTPYPHKYKTSLCKNWESTGVCKFEKGCSFAHGLHELQDKGEKEETTDITPNADDISEQRTTHEIKKSSTASKTPVEELRKFSVCGLS